MYYVHIKRHIFVQFIICIKGLERQWFISDMKLKGLERQWFISDMKLKGFPYYGCSVPTINMLVYRLAVQQDLFWFDYKFKLVLSNYLTFVADFICSTHCIQIFILYGLSINLTINCLGTCIVYITIQQKQTTTK